MYVWVDALTNYITGAGYPDTEGELWKFWPADLHVIGKDITRFHARLLACLPDVSRHRRGREKVFGHGFLLSNGEKMSKSLGNVESPFGMAEEYGVDQVSLLLPAHGPLWFRWQL